MSALHLDAEALYGDLLAGVRTLVRADSRLVGIWSGGAWLAERLQRDLAPDREHGVITSALHRDDFSSRGFAGGADPTRLPFEVDGRAHRAGRRRAATPAARSAPSSTSCSTSAARPASRWPCWSIGAAASCRSRRPVLRPRVTLPAGQRLSLARDEAGRFSFEIRLRRTMLAPPQSPAQPPRRADPPAVDRGPAARRSCTTSSTPPAPSSASTSARSRRCRCCAARACSTCSSRTARARAPPSRSPPSGCRPTSSTSTSRARRTAKGESLLDTIANLSAMHADMFVVRHGESGAPYLIAQHCAPHVHVVNAGDGRHAHPTQGLLDMYTIRHYKKRLHQPHGGDRRRHRAFARGPLRHPCADDARRARDPRRRPEDAGAGRPGDMGVRVCHDMAEGIRDADVIIMLRLQNERMSGAMLPSAGEFFKTYGLTPEKLALAKPDAIVMHPGPINRGVEIDSAVADGAPERDPAAGDLRHRGAHGGDVDHRRQQPMNAERR